MSDDLKTLRIEQIDAHELDGELRSLLLSQLQTVARDLPAAIASWMDRLDAELRLLVDGLLWTLRVYKGASAGQIMMDLAYKEYTPQKALVHFVLAVLIPYLGERLPDVATGLHPRVIAKISAFIDAFALLYHVRFLARGGHSSIMERVLGLRAYYNNAPTMGSVNMDSLTRELLWHTFRDALLLLLPFWRAAQRAWRRRTAAAAKSTTSWRDGCWACGHCERAAVVPVETEPCGHVFCHFCYHATADDVRTETGERRKACPTCGVPSTAKLILGARIQ